MSARGAAAWARRMLCLAPFAALACGDDTVARSASLSAPQGLAVALTAAGEERVFVANRAAASLQVLAPGGGTSKVAFAPAPARYHPVRLPTGDDPIALATAAGQRVVVVADGISGALRALDADRMTPLVVSGSAWVPDWPPPGGGARPRNAAVALAALDLPPGGAKSRLFVARGAPPVVEVIDMTVNLTASRVDFALAATWSAGGARPLALVASPTAGGRVFVADDQGAIWSLPAAGAAEGAALTAGAALGSQVVPIGAGPVGPEAASSGDGPAGPLALNGDGTLLAVGRARWQDVVFFTVASDGSLAVRPVDGADAAGRAPPMPPPQAVGACGPGPGVPPGLAGSHPSDRALCFAASAGPSVRDRPDVPYGAAFLGSPARALATIPAGGLSGIWAPAAGDAAGRGPTGEVLAVALDDGQVALLTLQGAENVPFGHPLLAPQSDGESGALAAPQVTLSSPGAADTPTLGEVFAPSALPAQSQRLASLAGAIAWRSGALAAAPPGARERITFFWEGVLAAGAGEAPGDGTTFTAPNGPLFAAVAQANDLLVITSVSQGGDGCPDPAEPLEVAITQVDPQSGALRLAGSIAARCFPEPFALAFEIRAPGTFVVRRDVVLGPGVPVAPSVDANAFARLPLGGAVGLASSALGEAGLAARLAAPDSCPWCRRDVPLVLEVVDPSAPQRLGQVDDGRGGLAAAGVLPGALAVVGGTGASAPALVSTYLASDLLLWTQLGDLTLAPRVLAEPARTRIFN